MKLVTCPRMAVPIFAAVSIVFGCLALARAEVDQEKLKQIPARLQKFVDDGTISGAVALVGYKGEIVSQETVGFADLAAKKPMTADAIYREYGEDLNAAQENGCDIVNCDSSHPLL